MFSKRNAALFKSIVTGISARILDLKILVDLLVFKSSIFIKEPSLLIPEYISLLSVTSKSFIVKRLLEFSTPLNSN